MLTLSILLMLGGLGLAILAIGAGASRSACPCCSRHCRRSDGGAAFALGLVLFLIWCLWPAPARADDGRVKLVASLEAAKDIRP